MLRNCSEIDMQVLGNFYDRQFGFSIQQINNLDSAMIGHPFKYFLKFFV